MNVQTISSEETVWVIGRPERSPRMRTGRLRVLMVKIQEAQKLTIRQARPLRASCMVTLHSGRMHWFGVAVNCNLTGQITETVVLLEAVKSGIIVSQPYGNKARYDMLFDVQGSFLRIQVKTSRQHHRSNRAFTFNCYSVSNGTKRTYTKQDIDYYATVWDDQVYLVPVDECATEKTLWLVSPKQNSCVLAEQYLFKTVISNLL